MSVNKVILLGNLTRDPELRRTAHGAAVCNFTVATNERRKVGEGWEENTQFHAIVVWGTTAKNCAQYLAKGRQVFVEGRLQTRKWEDESGTTHYRTEIVGQSVQFIGGAKEPREQEREEQGGLSFDDDEIPF